MVRSAQQGNKSEQRTDKELKAMLIMLRFGYENNEKLMYDKRVGASVRYFTSCTF